MPFTGGWATKARQRPTGHVVRTTHPTHSAVAVENEQSAEHWTAPPGVDWGDPGIDPWAVFVTDTPGDWTEQQPANEPHGHDYDPGRDVDTGTRPNDVKMGLSFGAYTNDNHESPERVEPPVAIVRGRNGRPENNPDEQPRTGQRVGRTWLDRQRNAGQRVTDHRVTYANLPTVGGDSTVDTVPDDPGPYSAPFSAWARGLNGGPRQPMLRRTPTPVSDSMMSDGLDDDYAPDAGVADEWIVG